MKAARHIRPFINWFAEDSLLWLLQGGWGLGKIGKIGEGGQLGRERSKPRVQNQLLCNFNALLGIWFHLVLQKGCRYKGANPRGHYPFAWHTWGTLILFTIGQVASSWGRNYSANIIPLQGLARAIRKDSEGSLIAHMTSVFHQQGREAGKPRMICHPE